MNKFFFRHIGLSCLRTSSVNPPEFLTSLQRNLYVKKFFTHKKLKLDNLFKVNVVPRSSGTSSFVY